MTKNPARIVLGTTLVGGLLLALARPAAAAPADEIGIEMQTYANLEANLGNSTGSEHVADEKKTYGKACDELVAKAKKKLKAGTEVVAWRFGDHPKARSAGDNKHGVKVEDLGWFCDRYRHRLDELAMRYMLDGVRYAEMMLGRGLNEEDKKNIRAGGQESRKRGVECLALAAQMTKNGVAADFEIKSARGNKATLGEMPALCEQLGKYADLLDAEWKVAAKQFEKPFVDAGITGDRLEWFVYYGPGIEVWYLKGCKGETTLAKIKKAPLLYHWLEGADGITIRRFQWKGDKLVKQTEDVYVTEKAAYKACSK